MKIHLLSGFLGSGKTTAIQHACYNLLQQNNRVCVITNDQGIKLVDGNFFEGLRIPNRKVVNGCFCCNYKDLDSCIQSLIETNNPDVIFAESVGSCTDIVATVLKPLKRFRSDIEVTISTFADARLLLMILAGNSTFFDETVRYIYLKQLEEAAVIIINKIDLINAAELAKIKELMQLQYNSKNVLYISATDADGIQQWLHTLDTITETPLLSLQIDYDTYGAGEAKLAWLDEELTIVNSNGTATQNAIDLANAIYKNIQLQQCTIGHLKFLINKSLKLSYTATTAADSQHILSNETEATLLINARVQATPAQLSSIVKGAKIEIEATTGSQMRVSNTLVFQPGYPHPTYRLVD